MLGDMNRTVGERETEKWQEREKVYQGGTDRRRTRLRVVDWDWETEERRRGGLGEGEEDKGQHEED